MIIMKNMMLGFINSIWFLLDLHAMRCAFRPYIEIGEFARIRDMLSRAVHYCPKQLSVYPYVLSMWVTTMKFNILSCITYGRDYCSTYVLVTTMKFNILSYITYGRDYCSTYVLVTTMKFNSCITYGRDMVRELFYLGFTVFSRI